MAYIRLSEISFLNKKHREFCESLFHDIQRLESQCLMDEEFIDYIRQKVGDNAAAVIAKNSSVSFRTLTALRITFWYYTGCDPSRVLVDTPKKDYVDIFDPLGDRSVG